MTTMVVAVLRSSNLRNDLTSAGELEFIVMKGDCYDAPLPADVELSLADRLVRGAWRRSSACVHRSPPGGGVGSGSGDNIKTAGQNRHQRRVIVSLDLADGDDDQEWYVSGRRRGWRSGMTQRNKHARRSRGVLISEVVNHIYNIHYVQYAQISNDRCFASIP